MEHYLRLTKMYFNTYLLMQNAFLKAVIIHVMPTSECHPTKQCLMHSNFQDS